MNNFKTLLEHDLILPDNDIFEAKKSSIKVVLSVSDYVSRSGGDLELAKIYAQRDTSGASHKAEKILKKKIKSIPFNISFSPMFKRINKKNEAEFTVFFEIPNKRIQEQLQYGRK